MVSDSGIERRVRSLKDISERISDIIVMRMKLFLDDSDDEQIRMISMSSGDINQRVKTHTSIIRKARELEVTEVEEIPDRIEDYIGTRISTPNKHQARRLWEYMRSYYSKNKELFCRMSGEPKFVPITVKDRNNYSISTGYQAYHITFVYDSEDKFKSSCDVCKWPVELQIMSQLWEFWADYSRKYFYRTSSSKRALPYQVAISKILDSADELMRATAEDLLTDSFESMSDTEKPHEESYQEEREIVRKVSEWLQNENRLTKLFGTSKLPSPVFLIKMQETCDTLSIQLDDVERFMTNPDYVKRYNAILSLNPMVSFLPTYQCMLMYSLMGNGKSDNEIVDMVNEELWLVGKKLRKPPTPGARTGVIQWYDLMRKFGVVKSEGITYRFFPNSFKEYIIIDENHELQGAGVTFDLELEQNPEHGTNYIARNMEFIE